MAAVPAKKKKNPEGRDGSGRFVKGVSGNPGGKATLPALMKKMLREHTIEAVNRVIDIATDPKTAPRDAIAATRLLMEYGYGRPAAEFDKERLALERRRLALETRRVDATTSTGGDIVVRIAPEAESWGD